MKDIAKCVKWGYTHISTQFYVSTTVHIKINVKTQKYPPCNLMKMAKKQKPITYLYHGFTFGDKHIINVGISRLFLLQSEQYML